MAHHFLSGFRYRITRHLCPQTKLNSIGREGGVKKSQIGQNMV